MPRINALLLFFIILLTIGCSGSEQLSTPGDGDPEESVAGIALPDIADLTLRSISETWDVPGGSFETTEPAPQLVTDDGGTGVFVPTWDASGAPTSADLAYAMYAFDLAGAVSGRFLTVTWETPPAAGDCWIALANYERSRWDWYELVPGTDMPIAEIRSYGIADNDVMVVVLLTGTAEARLTSLEFTGTPPEVVVTTDPDPAAGILPLTVDYDASASSSPNGSIDDYEWDFDGDLVFNEPGDESSARGSAAVQHTHHEFDTTRMRITDSLGLKAMAILPLAHYVEPSGVEDLVNLAAWDYIKGYEVDGRLVIIYSPQVGTDQYKLKYMRAEDDDGTQYGTPQVIADIGDQQPKFGFAIIDGHPAIAYGSEVSDDELRYRRALDAQGTDWGADQLIAADWDTEDVKLVEIDGKPGVVGGVKQESNWVFDLKWHMGTDAEGSSWEAPVLIQEGDANGGKVRYTNVGVVDGTLAVAYLFEDFVPSEDDFYALRFALATDASGSSWGTPVDVIESMVWLVNLHTATPMPGINFYSNFSGEQECYWVKANDVLGSTWGAPLDIATSPAKDGSGVHGASAIGDNAVFQIVPTTISTPVGKWAVNVLAVGLEGDAPYKMMWAVFNADTGKWEYYDFFMIEGSLKIIDARIIVKQEVTKETMGENAFHVWLEVRWLDLVTHKVHSHKRKLGFVWPSPDWGDTQHNRFQNYDRDQGFGSDSISNEG